MGKKGSFIYLKYKVSKKWRSLDTFCNCEGEHDVSREIVVNLKKKKR